MREIKFRAWDRKEKRMWEVLRYTFEGHPTITVQFNPTIKKWHEEFEIMQFTGLTDKNGKEIYEGDIIKFIDRTSDEWILLKEKTVGVVKWIDGKAGFQPQDIEKNHKGGHYLSYWNQIEEIEVIGNIFENQELLK